MKQVIVLALLFLISFSIRLHIDGGSSLNDAQRSLRLSSTESVGAVSYTFEGFPSGFVLEGNQLVYRGSAAVQGPFQVKITARDDAGVSDSIVLNLNINVSGARQVGFDEARLLDLGTIQGLAAGGASAGGVSITGGSSSIGGSISAGAGAETGAGAGSGGAIVTGGPAGTIISSGISASAAAEVNQILSRLNIDNTVIAGGNRVVTSYPQTVIAQGIIPNQVPNTQAISIATAQADTTNAGTVRLTEYDRNITKLFDQQTLISQRVANLLNVIRRGTANRDQAERDVKTFTTQLASAVEAHQGIAITISRKEAEIRGIRGGITAAEGELNSFRVEFNANQDEVVKRRTSIVTLNNQLGVARSNQDGLGRQIASTRANIDSLSTRLDAQSATCDKSQQAVVGLQANISTLLASIAGVDQRVAAIDADIRGFNTEIAALQAQIRALNDRIGASREERQRWINLNSTVPQQVSAIRAQIEVQQGQCANKNNNVFVELTAARQRLAELEGQNTNAGKEIATIQGSITVVNTELGDLGQRRDRLTLAISRSTQQLATLRAALPALEAEIGEIYLRGNQALRLVQTTNSSLAAATARFRVESDALTVANFNIQQARTEQQQIATQINLLLQENTAGLAFASAPLDSGLSGALGLTNSIDSINAYILRAYGSTVQLDSITRYAATQFLYNFGASLTRSGCAPLVTSGSSLTQASGSDLRVLDGTIDGINGNTWTVQTSAGQQTVRLDGCTVQLANVANYQAVSGDRVLIKGTVDKGTWSASQVTCLK